MMLPAPQVSDAELEALARAGEHAVAMDADVTGELSWQALMWLVKGVGLGGAASQGFPDSGVDLPPHRALFPRMPLAPPARLSEVWACAGPAD